MSGSEGGGGVPSGAAFFGGAGSAKENLWSKLMGAAGTREPLIAEGPK